MMSELSDDLLEEILCRVPALSLTRLRITCKRWNRLFNDRIFKINHFDKAPKQFLSLMLKEDGVCLMRISNRRFLPVKVKRELSLTDPHSRVDQIKIRQVSHCDGLLLCYTNTRKLVVWNPCTGQTKWIKPLNRFESDCTYALGSYQDKRSNDISYKILRHRLHLPGYPWRDEIKQEFQIYEINTNSWRTIDVPSYFAVDNLHWAVSLKGKTYWIGEETIEFDRYKCIISFDYTAERFERLCLLPYQSDFYETLSLSIVREEKLAVLLQTEFKKKTEIWVTNKIRETKEVSWSMVLALDLDLYFYSWEGGSFVFDEEKKVLVCFNDSSPCLYIDKTRVYIGGEDNSVREVDLKCISSWQCLLNYVPSLIQLEYRIGGKRKRDE